MPSQEIVQTEENILVFDNIFSRGYGFSPQVLTRIPQLSMHPTTRMPGAKIARRCTTIA